MKVAKILSKGLVVIPKDIRDRFQLKEGDKVIWELNEDKVILRPVKKGTLTEKYKGIVAEKLSPEELEELYGER